MNDYGGYVEKHNTALEAFRAEYSALTPPPALEMPERVERIKQDNRGAMFVIAILFLASVWVSAKHTVPALRGPDATAAHFIDDLAAVVMVDGALFLLGYALIRLVAGHKARIGWKLKTALYLSLAVALAANISQILLPLLKPAESGGFIQGVKVLVALLVGASAPITAFVLGDVLALLQVKADSEAAADLAEFETRKDEARARYKAEVSEWEAGLREAWNRRKSRIISIDRPAPAEIPAGNSGGIPAELPAGASNNSGGDGGNGELWDKVAAYFTANPAALNVKGKEAIEEMARGLGVGKTLVYDVRKFIKESRRD